MIADRLLRIPAVRRHDGLRTFIMAAWLGWQIESNWANPFLFAIYSIARPVASALILVVMYSVITDGAMQDPLFAYIYVGNALYILVSAVIVGVSWAVVDDREHYRVNKQMHTLPLNYYTYLLGRGLARLLVGSISVGITLLFGILAFQLPLTPGGVQWGYLLIALALGIGSMAMLGIIIAALTMQMARHFWSVGDAIAGGLYLFTGAIFPLDILPGFLQPIGFLFPATYWLEAMRRAMIPDAPRFPTLAGFSDAGLLAVLAAFTLGLGVLSVISFRWGLHQAKEKGIIDMESNY